MGKYSIKDLEKLSRIKAHTIRIWEKRYNLISPERTDTNIRYYGDNQVKRLLNISILNNNGVKVSHIADFTDEQIRSKVEEFLLKSNEFDNHIQYLIGAMMNLDEAKFVLEFNRFTEAFGFEDTMLKIIYPMLDRIGVLWLTDHITPAHEHFISNLIRQKLLAEINRLPVPEKTDDVWVLFLPEHESHEVGLLFAYYVLKNLGKTVFYLGQNVPTTSIFGVIEEIKCNNLFSIWTTPVDDETFDAYLDIAKENNINFLFSSREIPEKKDTQLLNSPAEFKEAVIKS